MLAHQYHEEAKNDTYLFAHYSLSYVFKCQESIETKMHATTLHSYTHLYFPVFY